MADVTLPSPPPPTQSVGKRRVLTCARLAVGVALIAWLIWKIDWRKLAEALPRVNVPLVVTCVLFYVILQVLSAFKWQLLLRAQGMRLQLRTLARFYFIGMFFNLFLPTIVGGDAMRAYLAAKEKGHLGVVMLSIFAERLTGFVALLIIGFIGAALTPALMGRNELRLLIFAAIACGGVAVAVVVLSVALRTRWLPAPVHKKLTQLYECLRVYGSRPQTLTGVMAVSFLFQTGMVALNTLLIRACGYDAPFRTMAFFVPVLTIASMLPISPNGLGIREITSVLLFQQIQIPEQVGLLHSLLYRLVVALASVPGWVFYLQGGKRKKNGGGE
jgi:hypothetical protein